MIKNALRYLLGPAKLRLLALQRNSRVLELDYDSESGVSDSELDFSDLETRLESLKKASIKEEDKQYDQTDGLIETIFDVEKNKDGPCPADQELLSAIGHDIIKNQNIEMT